MPTLASPSQKPWLALVAAMAWMAGSPALASELREGWLARIGAGYVGFN